MFDLISGWIAAAGAFGVFGLMLLENVFPPIPFELVMPLAGFQASQGTLSLTGILVAGTAGSVIGALPWYYAGKLIGPDRLRRLVARHGFWLTLDLAEFNDAVGWFERNGRSAVFFGRMVPGVRTLISVPAGLASMPIARFLALTAVGSAIWVGLLTEAGYVLQSQYERVQGWLDPVTTAIVAVYLFRLVRTIWQRLRS